jgi:phosphoglycerate kinase
MAVKTLSDLLAEGVAGRGVLVRSDLNVPLDEDGVITDPGRIIASVPTLKALSDAGAKVVVTAHLGRPKGAPDPKFSLAPVAAALGEKLGRHVQLAGDVVGTDALARAEGLTDGDVLLLENIRFDPRETTAHSSPTASVWCTASRRRFTTWPHCCRTTRARWWPPRSRCSNS